MLERPESEYPPSGCRWCGHGAYWHCGRWSDARHAEVGQGWHTYEHPTTERIKERMLARRALLDIPRIPK